MTSIDKLRQAVEQAPRGSKAATMRALLPSIEKQISQGMRREEIVEALNKNGFEISLNTFVVTLHRLRKEKRDQEYAGSLDTSSQENEKEVVTSEESEPQDDQEEKVSSEPLAHDNGEKEDLGNILDARDREDYGEKYLQKRPFGKMGKARSHEK